MKNLKIFGWLACCFVLFLTTQLRAELTANVSVNTVIEPILENKPENKIDIRLNEIKTAGQSSLKALEFFNAGKYAESIAACEVVLKINPSDQKIGTLKQSALKITQFYKQAEDFYARGEYQKAYDLREEIIQLNSNDALQKNLLQKTGEMLKLVKQGQVYFDQGQYQLAILEYEKIVKKNPADQIYPQKMVLCQDLSAKRITAFQYYERGRYAEAQRLFEELFNKNPTQLEYGRQASACEKALEALTKGDDLLANGQLMDAKNFFVKAKDINPKDENLLAKILLCDKLTWWIDQSRSLQQAGFFEEALQNWKAITGLAPQPYYQKQFGEVKKFADLQKQIGDYQKNQNFKAMINLMDSFKEFYFYKKQVSLYEDYAAIQQKGENAFAGGDYALAEKYFSELKKKMITPEKISLKFSAALKPGKTVTAQWSAPSLSQIKSAWLVLPGLPKTYFDQDQTIAVDLPRALLPGFYLTKLYLQSDGGQTVEEFKVIQILE
jgi:tetratricopeptide (TPR) repeat protein